MKQQYITLLQKLTTLTFGILLVMQTACMNGEDHLGLGERPKPKKSMSSLGDPRTDTARTSGATYAEIPEAIIYTHGDKSEEIPEAIICTDGDTHGESTPAVKKVAKEAYNDQKPLKYMLIVDNSRIVKKGSKVFLKLTLKSNLKKRLKLKGIEVTCTFPDQYLEDKTHILKGSIAPRGTKTISIRLRNTGAADSINVSGGFHITMYAKDTETAKNIITTWAAGEGLRKRAKKVQKQAESIREDKNKAIQQLEEYEEYETVRTIGGLLKGASR